jgi:hypothetical protein
MNTSWDMTGTDGPFKNKKGSQLGGHGALTVAC